MGLIAEAVLYGEAWLIGVGIAGFFVGSGLCVWLFMIWQRSVQAHRSVTALLDDYMHTDTHGLVLFDAQGRCVFANERARTLYPYDDYPPREQQGDISVEAVYEEAALPVISYLVELSEGLARSFDKSRHRGVYGKLHSVLVHRDEYAMLVEVNRMESGSTAVVLTDVTEMQKTNERLERLLKENRDLTHAAEAAFSGIAMTDPKQKGNPIVFANEAFCRAWDVDQSKVIGQDWVYVFSAQENVMDPGNLLDAIRQNKPAKVEWQNEEDGGPKWFSLALTPVFDENGNVDLYIAIQTDITEDKLREAQFMQAQKLEALGQLAGGIAHDFNNVLSIIDGFSRMASKEIGSDHAAATHIERVRQAVKRGAALTKQLLTFGRHQIVSESVTDIGKLVRDHESLLVPLLDASISLSIHSDPDLYVSCAQDGVSQILMNLVINARDAMPGGGTIFVDAKKVEKVILPASIPADKRAQDYVCLYVEDSGMGMDRETQARIFDPFFTTKEQGKGTGLGLSMVYGIVQQMGGHIELHSAPGEGTRFEIYLPLTEGQPAKRVVSTSQNAAGLRFDGYTALVVEDEPDLLSLTSGMLEELGMEVLRAENGNKALLLQDDFEREIDFLVTDVVMPELDGVRLAELIGEMRPETQIIFMSGYPGSGTLARVEVPQDACLLAKPVQFETLAGVLEQHAQSKYMARKAEPDKSIGRWQTGDRVDVTASDDDDGKNEEGKNEEGVKIYGGSR